MSLFDSRPTRLHGRAAALHQGRKQLASRPTGRTAALHQGLSAPVAALHGRAAALTTGMPTTYGVEFIKFNNQGRYIGAVNGGFWRSLMHGEGYKGQIVNLAGGIQKEFEFADAEHDVRKIRTGVVKYLVFVKESEVAEMLAKAGAFDALNKVYNLPLSERYTFIKREGRGGGKFDFTWTQVYQRYGTSARKNENDTTPFLFLIDGFAHNRDNFGNFLFAAAGAALGLSKAELSLGGQYNSLANPATNGYTPQLDSNDDQLSISLGHAFASNRQYSNKIR